MLKKNLGFVLLFIFVVALLFITLIVNRIESDNRNDALEGLPNYTEIRGDINVTDGINYEKQPLMGAADAPVKVVKFADFKCPSCKMWEEKYAEKFKQDYVDTGKVSYYFMNYAFLDRDSIMAGAAGEAIAKQSDELFWEFQQKLFEQQGKETKIWATPEFLVSFVKENMPSVDLKQFEKDLTEHTYMLDVKEDYKVGGSLGINGTPQFIVNGKLVPSSSYEDLVNAIESELAQSK